MSDATDVQVEYANEPATDESLAKDDPLRIELTEEKREEILGYLLQELEDAVSSRENRVKKWIKWRRQREAIPETTPAEHSMSNASRIEPPLTQIHAQTSYAKVKGYYDTGKPWFWQLKSLRDDPDSHDDAKFMTKYMGILSSSQTDLNLDKVKRIVSDEATFMGLLVVKVVWETLEWKFKSGGLNGASQTKVMTFHDGPSIIPISQEDTYYPPFWDEIQRMPWIAHELHMPLHEFENKVAQGFYDKPENDSGEIDPRSWLRKDFTLSEMESEKLRGFTPRQPGVIDLMEFHFYWDIDDDGTWEDLIFTVHCPSRTVVRAVYNGIAAREFQEFGYIPRAFMLESRGVGQICEYLQDEASGTHRLRNDGMKLSTIKMLALRRSVLRENKNTIYQGKVWVTDNPQEDMHEIGLGDVPPSSLQSENLVWSLAAQACGIPQPARGFSDPTLGTRDTARGQQMRLSQSQDITATIIESTSENWSRVGMLVYFLLVQNKDRVIWNERKLQRLKDDEIARLEKILSVPIEEVPRRMRFEIYTTDIARSFEARRDTLVKLMELTFQAQPQLVQLNMLVNGPQGMQLRQVAPDAWNQLLEIYVGSVNTLREIYRFADFDDTENYIQNVEKLEMLVKMMREQNAAQIQAIEQMRSQGGSNGAAGPGGPPAPTVGGVAGPTVAQGPGGPVAGGAGGVPVLTTYGGAGPGVGGQ